MSEAAALNDRFRNTTPGASVLVPKDLDHMSPLLGMVDGILAAIMDFEFPADYAGARDQGLLPLCEGADVRW